MTSAAAASASGEGPAAKKRKLEKGADGKGGDSSEISRIRGLPEVKKDFPLFAASSANPIPSVTVDMEEGQMLYLPAGWFHEVVSLSSEMPAASDEAESHSHKGADADALAIKGLDESHIALNFWFAPPSSGKGGSGSVDDKDTSPLYRDDYWERVFQRTLKRTPGAAAPPSYAAAAAGPSKKSDAGRGKGAKHGSQHSGAVAEKKKK